MNIRRDILWRVYVAYLLIAAFALAVFVQIIRVQFVQGAKWRNMADSLTTKFVTVEPVRGNIYSDDGSLLVTSLPEYELRMDLRADALTKEVFDEKIDSLGYKLSVVFQDKSSGEYVRQLRQARREGNRYFLIKRKVSFPQLQLVRTFPIFNMGRYKGGLLVIQKNKRVKTFQNLAARTIGYRLENVQPVGIEGAFDEYLGGQNGKRLMQRISGGVWMPINDDDEIQSLDGDDVVATLDLHIQDVAQQALYRQLSSHNAEHGCVVLMEVATGKIKAIANLTRQQNGSYIEQYNYAVGESSEPGSTFKLASYLSALEDGYLNLEDSVNTQGGKIKYADRLMTDSKEGGHGIISYREAFEVSSNVAVSKLIYNNYKDNPEKFLAHLRKLNLGNQLKLQIPGEGMPRIKSTEDKDWSKVSLPYMSIGYEVSMTPLQTLAFYNAIANNGKMIAPIFVSKVQKLGHTVKEFEPRVINSKICSDETLEKLKGLLEGVVKEGTAMNLNTAIYPIAGKTGTAQIAVGTGGYKQGKVTYRASFCGYFPADNPKYSMIVVVNSPSSAVYTGNVVAGPVFREIADKVYATSLKMYRDIAPDKQVVSTDVPLARAGNKNDIQMIYDELGISANARQEAQWVGSMKYDNSVALVERKVVENLVPNVTGMALTDALYLVENAGMRTKVYGNGKVIRQSIPVGSRIQKGSTMILELR